MGMPLRVVALVGSPSRPSSTAAVVSQILNELPDSIGRTLISLNDIPAEALLSGNLNEPTLQAAIEAVEAADGIVIGTPIYKASLSGLMKSFIDTLPQYGMADKVVWPVGTGGSLAHALALDYGVRPILQSMGARHIIQSAFFNPADLTVPEGGTLKQHLAGNPRYVEALRHFVIAVSADRPLPFLGHPQPDRAGTVPRNSA